MNENIFFDPSRLKQCGKNVIIGKTVRIRYPELVEIDDNVIIDDFTYISTALRVGAYVHIAAGCKMIGGQKSLVEMPEFSGISSNVILVAGSDDFNAGIAGSCVPLEFKGDVVLGSIRLGRHSAVGAGSVVLPNVTFGEGASLGAMSLATKNLEAWWLYLGIPAKKFKQRDKERIHMLERRLKEQHG